MSSQDQFASGDGLTSPTSVLDWVVRITEQRSEEQLAQCLVSTLAEVGHFHHVRIDRLVETGGERFLHTVATTVPAELGGVKPLSDDALTAAAFVDCAEAECMVGGFHRRALPIRDHNGIMIGFLVAEARESLAEVAGLLAGFVAVYRNYAELLSDAERDTLTSLKNRKTFDESIARIIASAAALPSGGMPENRRHFLEVEDYHWLGIFDIDHFKRINDVFGHVFGDEVLLLFARLMRKTFRAGDILFRYGGEEFVAVLEPATFEAAQAVFERFRATVEEYDFPQVGRVTCSIGFIRILPGNIPASVVGHADQALYYAKRNGRNQVCSYEMLVQENRLVPEHAEGETELF